MGAAVVFLPSCGSTGETAGSCTPNQTISCACPGGKQGVQTCASDGQSFGVCNCEGGSQGGGGSSTTGEGGEGGGTVQPGLCGNGKADPGECEVGSEFPCPEDCMGAGGSGGGTTTTTDTCAGHITFAGLAEKAGPDWGGHEKANGKTGYEAGVQICQSIGGDHPCDYEEVLDAEAAGELAGIPANTTAWIHRTTPALVNGVMSESGPGGRCNDWTYTTNHISDGEYVTFDQAGVPTYHLDNDTFYDGVNTSHAQPGALQCGGMVRGILCCFPACK